MLALLFAAALFILPLSCADRGVETTGDAADGRDEVADTYDSAEDLEDPAAEDIPVPPPGRTYIMTLGGESFDDVRTVAETDDGGLLFAGRTESFEPCPNWIIKVDRDGRIAWQKALGGEYCISAEKILRTAEGGFFLAGVVGSADGDGGTMIAAANADGGIRWIKKVETPHLETVVSVTQMTDGGYVVGSLAFPETDPARLITLMSVDGAGEPLWRKAFEAQGPETWVDVSAVSVGGMVAIINTSGLRSLVFKMDTDGNVTWSAEVELAMGRVLEARDGGLLLAGRDLIMKLDAEGRVQWQKSWDCWIASALETESGDFILVGNSSYNSELWEIKMIRLSSDGSPLWNRRIRTGISDWVYQAALLSDGDIAVAGRSGYLFFNIYHDAFLGRLTETGEVEGSCDIIESPPPVIEDALSQVSAAEVTFEDVSISVSNFSVNEQEIPGSIQVYCPD